MKYSFFLLLVTLLITSCQPADKSVALDLNFINSDAKEAVVNGQGYEKKIALTDGKLTDTLQISAAGVYSVRAGRAGTELFLRPGDKVILTADAKDFAKTLSANGINKNIIEYKRKKAALEKRHFPRSIYQSEEGTFSKALTMVQDSFTILLDAAGLDKSFAAIETKSLKYDLATNAFAFINFYKKDGTKLAAPFNDPLKTIDLRDEAEYVKNSSYRQLVGLAFSESMQSDTVGSYSEIFRRHIAELKPGTIKNALLVGDMQYLMGPNDELDQLFTFFKEHSTDKRDLAKMQKAYDDLASLAKGQPSPSFDYINHKGGKTKLEDLEGKYVYVDVWATWCGPCIAEIPALKETEKKYHGKNIEFVSISIDEQRDSEKWKSMVMSKELGGTQLFADNAWQSKFVQDYKINGIPRFLLIDPEGKIVSADAPRPSDKKLIKTLDALSI